MNTDFCALCGEVDKLFKCDVPDKMFPYVNGYIRGLNRAGAISDEQERNLTNYALAIYQQEVRCASRR